MRSLSALRSIGNARSILATDRLTADSTQEALRTYRHPIKNEDLWLDFHTMCKRETMEYDTEYLQKYNEDLNATRLEMFHASVHRMTPYGRTHEYNGYVSGGIHR